MRSRVGTARLVSEATPGLNAHLMSVEVFEAVARALNDAGVPFIAQGRWSVGWITVREPGWFGFFVVPPNPDDITRALAALAEIGYKPEAPVFPDAYGKLLGPPLFKRGQGLVDRSAGTIKLLPETASHRAILLVVDWPARFPWRHHRAPVEEIAPGVPVRTIEADIRILSYGYRDCPQSLARVRELARIWREEGPEGLGGPFSALPGSRGTGCDLPPSFEWGIRFERYATIVAVMNGTGMRYILDGHWDFRWDELPPLGWWGDVVIPMDVDSARKTFEALASLGYAPCDSTGPEEFVDPSQADRWKELDDDEDDARMLHFAPHEHSTETDITVVALQPSYFEQDRELAHLDELMAGTQVLVYDSCARGAGRPRWCPQELVEVVDIYLFVQEMIEEVKAAFPEGGAKPCGQLTH